MRVRGLFFDLGGTLFSYSRSGQMGKAISGVTQALGIDAEPAAIGRQWRAANEAVMQNLAKQPYFLHRDLFEQTLTQFGSAFGAEIEPAVIEQFIHRQRDAVVDHLPIREDTHDALRALKDRGLYLSIVSNIDDDYLHPLVEKHGLDEFLDHWTSSEEARSCKPDTKIYHYSANKAGMPVEDVLFIGDSLHHDVAGAHAAGMRSVRIIEEGVTTPLTAGLSVTAEPDWEITSLHQLVEIVDELNN